MRAEHVVLCGPSGAGKSTVGPLVADALRRPFLDVDELVQYISGETIAEIFARGEAEFRARERAAVRSAFDEPVPAVIALGGGSLLEPATLELALRETLVYLDAPLTDLVARTAGETRPLLAGTDRASTIAALLDVRRSGYERAPLRIAADADAATVAKRVVAAIGARA